MLMSAGAPVRTPESYTVNGAWRVLKNAAHLLDQANSTLYKAGTSDYFEPTMARTERNLKMIVTARSQAEDALAMMHNLQEHRPKGAESMFNISNLFDDVTSAVNHLDSIVRRYPTLEPKQIADLAEEATFDLGVAESLWEMWENRN